MSVRRFGRWSALAVIALLGAGCGGYQLGDPTALPFSSVHVEPPRNISAAPQAEALVGSSLARTLARSGRVTLADEPSADAVLSVTLTDYRRDPAAERSTDTRLARKWRVTLTAECTLARRGDAEPFFTRRVISAFDEVYVDSGLVSAEYQNMPVLAERLAEEIAYEVLGAW